MAPVLCGTEGAQLPWRSGGKAGSSEILPVSLDVGLSKEVAGTRVASPEAEVPGDRAAFAREEGRQPQGLLRDPGERRTYEKHPSGTE